MALSWFADEISRDVDSAIETAIDQTMADCVMYAQQPPGQGGAPVVTGWLSSNITFLPAKREGDRIVGEWGNVNEPDYSLIVNLRNPYLQRAADEMYPTLAERIRENYGGGLPSLGSLLT